MVNSNVMTIDVYSKTPESLLSLIKNSIIDRSSHHMELWEIVSEKGVDYLTLRDVKYYFKVLLKPEIIDSIKIRFLFEFHEYSDHRLSVQSEYVGKFSECIIYNFITKIKGIQIFPNQ